LEDLKSSDDCAKKIRTMKPAYFFILPVLTAFIFLTSCSNQTPKTPPSVSALSSAADTAMPKNFAPKMSGLNFVAPPRPFKGAVMNEVKGINANWIAPIPYAFSRNGEPSVHYSGGGGHWWGESPEGVRVTIDSAHRAGIKVMLKPQVYVPDGWPGSLDFNTDADWEKWEKEYVKYLMIFVDLGIEMKVEAICVGTEFRFSTKKREKFWRDLIAQIRKKYSGQLTYSSTWDEYAAVPFWDALDFAGINAYMPLVEKDTPSVSELCEAWKPYCEQIKAFQLKIKKPIVFTEYGYLSVDGCGGKNWELEKKVKSLKINELAQANAFDALHRTFGRYAWWQGSFLWKWFPDGQGHEGYFERDYTPQGKQGAATLRKWHGLYPQL
jgi:hypothetical protein